MKKIYWIAGEKSGDLHAALVMKKINEQHESYHYGIGGEAMQASGLHTEIDFSRLNMMGFVEIIKHLGFLSKLIKKIQRDLTEDPPDLLILVDYPGLNMRIAEFAKKRGIKVLYYICPKFWAWKEGRKYKLKKFTDHVCYILPFEKELLEAEDIQATYVGNPISEEIELNLDKEEFARKYDLDINKQWIGFMPGSRNNEIEKILPEMVEAISYFSEDNYQALISQANSVSEIKLKNIINPVKDRITVIRNDNYEMMRYCDVMAVTSGTATLETAFMETPHVIVYKTNPISYVIAQLLVKIKWIGLPNIIMDEELLPELIQADANGKNIAGKMLKILTDEKLFDAIQHKLKKIRRILGEVSTSEKCVEIIQEMIGD